MATTQTFAMDSMHDLNDLNDSTSGLVATPLGSQTVITSVKASPRPNLIGRMLLKTAKSMSSLRSQSQSQSQAQAQSQSQSQSHSQTPSLNQSQPPSLSSRACSSHSRSTTCSPAPSHYSECVEKHLPPVPPLPHPLYSNPTNTSQNIYINTNTHTGRAVTRTDNIPRSSPHIESLPSSCLLSPLVVNMPNFDNVSLVKKTAEAPPTPQDDESCAPVELPADVPAHFSAIELPAHVPMGLSAAELLVDLPAEIIAEIPIEMPPTPETMSEKTDCSLSPVTISVSAPAVSAPAVAPSAPTSATVVKPVLRSKFYKASDPSDFAGRKKKKPLADIYVPKNISNAYATAHLPEVTRPSARAAPPPPPPDTPAEDTFKFKKAPGTAPKAMQREKMARRTEEESSQNRPAQPRKEDKLLPSDFEVFMQRAMKDDQQYRAKIMRTVTPREATFPTNALLGSGRGRPEIPPRGHSQISWHCEASSPEKTTSAKDAASNNQSPATRPRQGSRLGSSGSRPSISALKRLSIHQLPSSFSHHSSSKSPMSSSSQDLSVG